MIENGQHRYEYIRLTEADLDEASRGGGYAFDPEAFDGTISLVTKEGEDGGRFPASLYALAAEKCGFVVASPRDIGGIVHASITVSRQGQSRTQVVKDEKRLKKLASILKSAKKTSLGNCPYTSVLTLTMKDGRVVTVQKATDSCGTMIFGSASCYWISDKANKQFWQIFAEVYSVISEKTK